MPETALNNEYVPPKAVMVRHDLAAGNYSIVDTATGKPALTKNGKRMDGGGHDFEDKAQRQVEQYIQPGLDNYWKKVENQGDPE